MRIKQILKWVIVLALAVPALYVLVQMYAILHHTYRTETAISYTMYDTVPCDGVVVFQEQLMEGAGNIGYLVDEGERVSNGTQVAEIYTDSSQAVCREQLTSLDRQISLLERSQNASGTSLSILSAQMQSSLYRVLDAMDGQDYAETEMGEQDYLLSANRFQISTGKATSFTDALSQLQAQRDQVLAQLGSPEGLYAGINGYFVSAGGASFLNYDETTIRETSPGALDTLLDSNLLRSADGLAGKVVTSYLWHYYGVCNAADAAKIEPGDSVKITFPGKAETPLPATVDAVEIDEESGLAKVTVRCEYVGAEVLRLGRAEARLQVAAYEGIRVDAKALHIVDDARGVYVKYGDLARFRKIAILYQDDNYILVPPGGKVGSDNEVRLYDEVIVEGTDLRDGKLL